MKENVVINKMETRETCPKIFVLEKPDYSKMYFEFQFKDGEKARYRMDKDCHNLQQFLDRMNNFHELEKENKRLQEQLRIATDALQEYSCGNNWLDAGCRGQVFLPTKRGYSIADKALDEMEEEE